jgi:hypothetical protein
MAQRFAAGVMMPKLAIEAAFARRGWSVPDRTPETVFVVSQDLGVGFTTLVGHLERTMGRISDAVADTFRRIQLPRLRARIAGFKVDNDVVVVDEHWGRRPIDVEIGDVVLLPKRANFDGTCAVLISEPVLHLMAEAPGEGSVSLRVGRAPVSVRVSRRGYIGLARYRHLEEVLDEL